MSTWLLAELGDDRHPDLHEQEHLYGVAHTTGGRFLPRFIYAATPEEQEVRLADPAGWSHHVAFEPSQLAIEGARQYAAARGLPDPHDVSYHDVMRDPDSVRQVGRAYDALPDFDPSAVPHYEAMRREVNDQYDHMTNNLGIQVQPVDHDPYPDVHHMMNDINNNKRLQVLGTHVTGGHPLFSNEDNDKFRAVHDFFGHAATGRSFDRHGEQAAFLAHSKMFSPQARPALHAETQGQNSSLILNGHFGPQKIAVMPESLQHGIQAPAMPKAGRRVAMPYFHNTDAELNPGDEVVSASERGHDSKFKSVPGYSPQHVYMYDHNADPLSYDWLGKNRYEVEPIGSVSRDPEFEHNKSWYKGGLEEEPDSVYSDEDVPGYNSYVAPRARVVRRAVNAQDAADMMRFLVKNPEGITVRHNVGDAPSSGFMVSHPGEREISRSRLNPHEIRQFQQENADRLAEPDNYYGGWSAPRTTGHDQPGWYHDVSKNVHDPRDAAEMALRNHQQAVYDLDHGEEVSTPDMVNRATSPGVWLNSRRRWYR